MKVVVIGGNAAGLSAASAIRRGKPDWEIQVFEQGQYISYGSCGLPYYVSGIVENSEKLITITQEDFLNKRNIPIFTNHRIIEVNFNEKWVSVLNLNSNKESREKFDFLVISTGAKAKITKSLDIEHPFVFKMHIIPDANKIKTQLLGSNAKSGVIIGSGYIGLEMLEAYKELGINDLTIIGPRLVFKSKSQEFIQKELEKNGVKVILGIKATSLSALSDQKLKITLEDGIELETDFVQISIGVKPNTNIFENTKLNMLKNGAIITDEFMRTNIPNVYAAGDCCAIYHQILKKEVYIPLAPAANKMGRIAGKRIAGISTDPFPGVMGTAIFKVFDLHCAKTGINVEEAKELGKDVETTFIENNEIAHYYPNKGKMTIMLVFDTKAHLLLGAEITSPTTLGAKKIDVFATALAANMKIEDIQKLDLSYAPPFAPVWSPVLVAANVARKKLK